MFAEAIIAIQWLYLFYFLGLTGGYYALNGLAFLGMLRFLRRRRVETRPQVCPRLQLPISLLVPAHNEAGTIQASLSSLLQIEYPEFEIVVCNDGSRDETLAVLIDAFDLIPFPEDTPPQLATKRVRGVYASRAHPNLRVIDKENGGKADALNAALNIARHPLFCCIDADSILQRDSLTRAVQPFLEDPTTIAVGGVIRVVNGCEVHNGYLVHRGLPRNPLALFQIVEYLRAFLFGRLGWAPLNALLIISGAFGLFKTETVLEAGGYRTDTVGEDMELVVRLHRLLRLKRVPYRIHFLPDAVCWTEAPEDLRTLRNQRIRWQRGLVESLMLNRGVLFHPRAGAVGWIAFPFFLVFEAFGPTIEVCGSVFMAAGYLFGYVSFEALRAFASLALASGVLLSVNALLLEEMSFRIYPRVRDLLLLLLAVVVENLGYRQMNASWRLIGFYRWARRSQGHWGAMTRKASWSQADLPGRVK